MKKAFLCFVLLCSLLLSVPVAYADNAETTVHITRTGDCYHRAGCGALRSDIPVTLRYAVEHGYLVCDRCDPPLPDFEYVSNQTRSKSDSSSSSSSSSGGSASKIPDSPEEPTLLSRIIQGVKRFFSLLPVFLGGAYFLFLAIYSIVGVFQILLREIFSRLKSWWRKRKDH